MYCSPDSRVQDEERRHKEVPRFCVNSLLRMRKLDTILTLVIRTKV